MLLNREFLKMNTYLVLSLGLVLLNDLWERDVALIVLETFRRALLEWKLTVHLFALILHHAVKRVKR